MFLGVSGGTAERLRCRCVGIYVDCDWGRLITRQIDPVNSYHHHETLNYDSLNVFFFSNFLSRHENVSKWIFFLTWMALADRLRSEQERRVVFHLVSIVDAATIRVSVHCCLWHFRSLRFHEIFEAIF